MSTAIQSIEASDAHIVRPILSALRLSRASFYRASRPNISTISTAAPSSPAPARVCPVPGRRLSEEERETVRQLLYSGRFVDRTPTEVFPALLDEGVYHCSIRTMYRLLKEEGATTPRTRARQHTAYEKPELLATRPNQLWSWDITRLKGPRPWTYFYLYVIIDVFSRCVVGFMAAYRESQELAKEFIEQTIRKQGIEPGQLSIHADRGSAMTSKSVALLLSDLGVVKTHSRPYVSNDNPYSEAQFKTLKYRPEFPNRFGSIEDARAICARLFDWYNAEHHHGGIALLTPAMVHHGRASEVIALRQRQLDAAYQAHPERFVNRPPRHPDLPEAVWINPPLATVSAIEKEERAAGVRGGERPRL
jgi:putative transposase